MTRCVLASMTAGLALAMLGATAAPAQDYPAPKPILETGADILGAPIEYPEGAATVTSLILDMAPGQETGWHLHEVPLFVHILEGAITVDYGAKGTRTYKAGDTFMEAQDWWHNGRVEGDAKVRILVVYFGTETAHNVLMRQ